MGGSCFSCLPRLRLANPKHLAVRRAAVSDAQSGSDVTEAAAIEPRIFLTANGSSTGQTVCHHKLGGPLPCTNLDLHPSVVAGHSLLEQPVLPPMDMQSPRPDDSSASLADGSKVEEFQEGDLVLLGRGVPSEFRQHAAVITKTAATHCTVIVLDKSERFGMGECWPMFTDLQLKSSAWRLGRHVVIDGMRGPKGKRLNGCSGVICNHPREGHPVFVQSKAHPEQPHLVVCVHFDKPPAGADSSVLLEPRFLLQQCP